MANALGIQADYRLQIAPPSVPKPSLEQNNNIHQVIGQAKTLRPGLAAAEANNKVTEASVKTAASTTEAMSTMLGAIASVSLLVGGIGIMNIMLVPVTERTREMGIRMAIGAKNRDILLQFLFEAVMISLAGSFIGAALGIACAYFYSQLNGTLVVATLSSVLLAFGVAASVGVFFGFYPARKAANLKPIKALHFQ